MKIHILFLLAALFVVAIDKTDSVASPDSGEGPTSSKECIACHRDFTPVIVQQWGASKHYGGGVACYDCHQAKKEDNDAFEHFGHTISVIVSPKDCARCHQKEVSQFAGSRHSKAARILGSLDNLLAEVVEGNKGFITKGFPQGNAASAVTGCWQCHGSEVKVLENGALDPATWPNTGIGRINPDGSEGSCSACHARHIFSVAQARNPENCGKCHMGPDHPQLEIYQESKHGIAFYANKEKMNLENGKWILGEDYNAAPTCATCHMSATPKQDVTHDVGLRISWNNRPALSIRPEIADAKLGLPGKDIPWLTRRGNMQDVCTNCHSATYVDSFYVQYDALIDLYNTKFATPGEELMALAKPLLKPVTFGNKLEFIWFEIWHHEGRRARHGASMMGPDYTQWHGMYEVAKNFYTEFIPELTELIEKHLHSDQPDHKKQAELLNAKLADVLASADHRWFIGKMDPEEKKQRAQQLEKFKGRYKE